MKEYSVFGSYIEDITLKSVGKSIRENRHGYHGWKYTALNSILKVELLQNCCCPQRDIQAKLKSRKFFGVAYSAGLAEHIVHQGSPPLNADPRVVSVIFTYSYSDYLDQRTF